MIMSLLPLVAVDYWWIRMFDFPHLQLTTFTLLAILVYFIRFDIRWINDYIFVGIMLSCFLFQFYKIYPYTPLFKTEVPQTKEVGLTTLKLFTANVLQKNKKHKELLNVIDKYDPDIVLLTETDQTWQAAVATSLNPVYPYQVLVPQENTYGMLLYSKFPISDQSVMRLVDKRVPSVEAKVLLPSGHHIQLFCIHPTPPLPQHNPTSTDRDAAMMKIAKKSNDSQIPVVVMGDFNDVAWSSTTTLFQETSRLLDPRKGRGFYNTYHASNPLLRWPLDHIFISKEFQLNTLEVGAHIGSDHLPVYTEISLATRSIRENPVKRPSEEEQRKANEIIREESKKDSTNEQ